MERNARQLALMVEDLLDSGAIVSGKLSVHISRLRLEQLIKDIAADLRPEAERKGLQLLTPVLEESQIHGDEARIKQIVWNLHTNAINFCDAGCVEVTVTVTGDEAGWRFVTWGAGLHRRALDRVFTRFEQLNENRSGRVGGLGLGLRPGLLERTYALTDSPAGR